MNTRFNLKDKHFFHILFILFILCGYQFVLALDHGSIQNRTRNIHSGNQVRMTFHNHDMQGVQKGDQSLVYGGEWPINSGLAQMGNTSGYMMAEFNVMQVNPNSGDTAYFPITPVVFSEGWDPERFSHDDFGRFQGFEPLPGYYNEDNQDQFNKAAMSHQPYTWPAFWPDKLEDIQDPGWVGEWNGYFGKGVMSADQESYSVNDDYQFDKNFSGYFDELVSVPPPIADEPDRGGFGIRKTHRGLQWSNPKAQDVIFWVYEIKNFGELRINKALFGMNVGASMGGMVGQGGSDNDDDGAAFFRERNLTIGYEPGNVGVNGYSPVPVVGFAFLESPGNPFDGIDNDGDAADAPGGGHVITTADFAPRLIEVGDPVVVIDYQSDFYDRTVIPMPAEGISFTYLNEVYHKDPGMLFEGERNGIDDDLDGLIDENDGWEFTETGEQFYLYADQEIPYRTKNYITGEGLTNLMIDERRNDGIDNDGDWDPYTDDVGLDGKEATGDTGEGDGLPTPGEGDLPGEPHIDLVDVKESDQIGLTSFIFYEFATLDKSNDELMWDWNYPGFFDGRLENVDADYLFSCGYFPSLPEKKDGFSIAMIYGWDTTQVFLTKETVQDIYDANYNFAVAPKLPTVWAVPGDRKVTLYWDDDAEESIDRYLNEYDFEGYKIYRATDPGFSDAGDITDGFGYPTLKKPIATFDKIDGVSGFYPESFNGLEFFLGNESGLVHTFVDSPLVNGMRYYYAVTAYDKGDLEKDISPTETSKYATIDASGVVQTAQNVISIVPAAPALGYIPPGFTEEPYPVGAPYFGDGLLLVDFTEPDSLVDGQLYQVDFLDNGNDGRDNTGDGFWDEQDFLEAFGDRTTGFALNKVMDNDAIIPVDTVWFKEYRGSVIDTSWITLKNLYMDTDRDTTTLTASTSGFRFFLHNPPGGILHDEDRDIHNGVKWSENIDYNNTYPLIFGNYQRNPDTEYPGKFIAKQYRIVFDDALVGQSELLRVPKMAGGFKTYNPRVTNFIVEDLATCDEFLENCSQAHYASSEEFPATWPASVPPVPNGFFSVGDQIIFFEHIVAEFETDNGIIEIDTVLHTLHLENDGEADNANNAPGSDQSFYNNYSRFLSSGDTLYLYTTSEFNRNHVFEFEARGHKVDAGFARRNLDDIRVVPNPYVVTNMFEPRNPYSSGHGPRVMKFINLPAQCTIRIYSADGTLIRKLEHSSAITRGEENWDMLTVDNMDIAYGLYVYHVDAPGIGEYVGKFLVIK